MNSPKRRRLFLSIATVAIVVSAVVIGVKGLNLGIDFKGGTQITFKTPKPTSLSTVRDQMKTIGRGDAVVQGRGKATGSESYTSFQIRTKSLTANQQNALQATLNDKLGATSAGIKNVSSSFSRQIARGAIFSVLVSFLLIAIYISFRFQWRFALPIVRTLFNDILITLGVYALSGREVTTATVAAILTVLGYSIYDTIIVFDRVRENLPLMPRAKFATIANISLWQTVRRSLATTFITLLPVVSLLLFGGATLKDFAFALFIGIGLGAYLDVLRRDAVPDRADGAQPRVQAPDRRRRDGEGRARRGVRRGCREVRPGRAGRRAGDRSGAGAGGGGDRVGHRRRVVEIAGEAGEASSAQADSSTWQSPLAATRSSAWRSPRSGRSR